MEGKIYNRKRLDRAFTTSIWALTGLLIPVLGFILALIAVGINSGVEADTKRMKERQQAVRLISSLAIGLSILGFFGWRLILQTYYS